MPSFIHRLTTPKTCTGANTVLATLPLPAGSYIVTAKAEMRGFTGESAVCQARLVVGSDEDSALRKLAGPGLADDIHPIHLKVGANLATASSAQFIITMASFRGSAQGVVMTADLIPTLSITEAEGDPLPPEN